jgi:hypothetical protein
MGKEGKRHREDGPAVEQYNNDTNIIIKSIGYRRKRLLYRRTI